MKYFYLLLAISSFSFLGSASAAGPKTGYICYSCWADFEEHTVGCGVSGEGDGWRTCNTDCGWTGCSCTTGEPCVETFDVGNIGLDGRVAILESSKARETVEELGSTLRTCGGHIFMRSYRATDESRLRTAVASLSV